MNPDDLADLVREWKEIELRTLTLAVDTAQKRSRAQASVWLIYGLNACLAVLLLSAIVLLVRSPTPTFFTWLGVVLAMIASFVPFSVRQLTQLKEVDRLLKGAPADTVRARLGLLRAELVAWDVRYILLGVPLFAALLGWLWWLGASHPVHLPLFVGMVAFCAYGRWWRVPNLEREISELDALLRDLEEDG